MLKRNRATWIGILCVAVAVVLLLVFGGPTSKAPLPILDTVLLIVMMLFFLSISE